MKQLAFVLVLMALIVLLCGRNPASAYVITYSDANISNFQWSSPGTLNWSFDPDPWCSYAATYAFDTASGSDWDEDPDLDGDGEVSASASTDYASAQAQASGTALTADTRADINIPDALWVQADADGYADLYNQFYITGGVGDVDVTFSLDFSATLYGSADELGYFESQFSVGMDLTDWEDTWTLADANQISGTNTTISRDYKGHLCNTFTLQYDTDYEPDYEIILYADSEVYAYNTPEPGTLILFTFGLIGLAGFLKKKKRPSSGKAA